MLTNRVLYLKCFSYLISGQHNARFLKDKITDCPYSVSAKNHCPVASFCILVISLIIFFKSDGKYFDNQKNKIWLT